MKKWLAFAAVCALTIMLSLTGQAQEKKDLSIKEIMTKAHKGGDSLLAKLETEVKAGTPDWDTIQKQTGLNVVVDKKTMEEANVAYDSNVSVKVRRASAAYAIQVFQDRLQRADRKGHSHERESDHDPQRCESALDAHRDQPLTEPAIASEKIGKCQPSDRCRQCERKVNERIDKTLSEKVVSHQHPRENRSKHRVRNRRDKGSSERKSVGRQGAIRCHHSEEIMPAHLKSSQKKGGDRDQDEHAQVKSREAHGQAKSRQSAESFGEHLSGRTYRREIGAESFFWLRDSRQAGRGVPTAPTQSWPEGVWAGGQGEAVLPEGNASSRRYLFPRWI